MSNSISYSRSPVPANIIEYIYLKEVRANTALIDGKIIYDRLEWTEEDYNSRFPEPVLQYLTTSADPHQIKL